MCLNIFGGEISTYMPSGNDVRYYKTNKLLSPRGLMIYSAPNLPERHRRICLLLSVRTTNVANFSVTNHICRHENAILYSEIAHQWLDSLYARKHPFPGRIS